MSDIEHSEDLAESQIYPSIEAGMEIITGNGIILGRAISGHYDPQSDSFRLLFVDSIHPILNFCSSIYELPAVSIVTIGHNRIVIAGDVIPEIVETRVGMFRFLGLVSSLNAKIERKKRSYQRLSIVSKKPAYHRLAIDSPEERLLVLLAEPCPWHCEVEVRQRRVPIEPDNSFQRVSQQRIELIDWANDGWEYNMDRMDRIEDFWGDNLDWNDNDRTDDEDLPGAGVLRPKKPNPNLPPLMMLVDEDENRF